MESFRRAAARGTAFSLVSIVATRAIGFFTSLLLARFLGPGDFGAWSILIGFHSVAFLIGGLGLPLIAPKLVAESTPGPGPAAGAGDALTIRTVVTAALVFGLAAGALIWVMAPLLARWMIGPDGLAGPVRGTALAVTAVVWSNAGGALLQGRHQIRRLAVYNTGLAALNLGLVLPAARQFGLAGALAALSVSHLLFSLTIWLSLPAGARVPGWSPAIGDVLRRGLRLGWPLLASTLLVPLVAWMARTWLGHQSGLDAVGRYQVAETLNQAILFVPLAITMPLYPMVASLAARDRAETVRALAPVFGYVVLFTLPAALIVGWLAPLWVRLFGPGYSQAWPVVYLLTGGYFLSSLGHLSGAVLTGFGWTGRGLMLNLFWAAALLLSAVLIVPHHGAVGLAVSYGLAYLAQTVVLIVALRKWLGLNLVPAPRIVALWGVLFGAGWWFLPRVTPEQTPWLVLPAVGMAVLVGATLWRRAATQLLAWLGARPVE